ncbi:hypothetical protein EIK77_004406 [Talaromyces pinophilus]|nr:hypothetical protein EIK77_004406 [Talaromyces pinophilus]
MSDFTPDDAEQTNGSGPSPFLEPNTGARPPTFDLVRDVPQDETSWSLQYVSDIHIPPDPPLLGQPEDEQAQHGTVAFGEAVASDSYFFPNPDFAFIGHSEAGLFSSDAGAWFHESINTIAAENTAQFHSFDIGSSSDLIPRTYPQQFPCITPWNQAQTNQNVATLEDNLQFYQNTFMAPSDFDNFDLTSSQYGTSRYPDLLSSLDIYHPVQSSYRDSRDDHLNPTSQPFEDTNISLHQSIPFSGFEPLPASAAAAAAAGDPPYQNTAQVFSDQLAVFGPSAPVELPLESSRKRSEKAKRDSAVVRRWACWKCKRHNKLVGPLLTTPFLPIKIEIF